MRKIRLLLMLFLLVLVEIVFALSFERVSLSDENETEGDFSRVQKEFSRPSREFTLLPFWFWNDVLNEKELVRQIDEFEKHGVYGFTIHPRVGLPEDTGWLSDKMIHMMHVVLREAKQRDMRVMLYDDGMYPSGSSSGQVVAFNRAFASRGFSKVDVPTGQPVPPVKENSKQVAILERPKGNRIVVYDEPSGGTMRGLHFIGNENVKNPQEQHPPTADVLNPQAVECFVRLVYQRYYDEFREYFQDTIVGIFTDEPDMLGRGYKRGMTAGQTEALQKVNTILGYDFTPYLADLWYDDTPESPRRRNEYKEALQQVFEESYYGTISHWCRTHHIALAGHPALSSDSGVLAKFDIPGQDIVWRYIEPGEKALGPPHSMMAKVASSAMIHHGQRRNLNEVYGAYGHELTFKEVQWLARWCFVRGHNMLVPHAFYYSIRGPRFEERPPDVGPNSPWWPQYKPYADACSRLCWLNTDSRLVASVAILVNTHEAAVAPARPLYENQIDFSYLEFRDLVEKTKLDEKGIHIANMNYQLVVLPDYSSIPANAKPYLEKLAQSGKLVLYGNTTQGMVQALHPNSDNEFLQLVREKTDSDLVLDPANKQIRVRHVVKYGVHFYYLFNEVDAVVETNIVIPVPGKQFWFDVHNGSLTERNLHEKTIFQPFEAKLIGIGNFKQ